MTAAAEFHVSPSGDDSNPGSTDKPFATLPRAQQAARGERGKGPVSVLLHGGTHYLKHTFVLTPEDSGTTYAAAAGEKPVISGGTKLQLTWSDYKGPIKQAAVPKKFSTDQLFVNGQGQPLARFPNANPKERIFNGYAADAFSPERAKRWANPAGGFLHVMHRHMWGGYHYRIAGKNKDGSVAYEGGWQNNRQLGMHDQYRFVEGIFEELDAPGEWFLDSKAGILYYYPPEGLDLNAATFEAVRLANLVDLRGTQKNPVRNVTLRGLTFRHAARTFMDTREPLLRSDWTIYRGGAVYATGAEDCSVSECEFDQVGGNGFFADGYNRRLSARACHVHDIGASAFCFVGSPAAVRNGLTEGHQKYKDIDKTPGPKTDDYPADCLVEDCLIHNCGRVEKQIAGVQISMAMGIAVRHCSIYDMPRAGINISEGTWGGHLIEGCDVFDTVLETSDHGSFNSWGRDRFFGLQGVNLHAIGEGPDRHLALLDAVKTTVIRDSRWRCDHGWDIDLDDGSSNYHLYNNLCLRGGIKLREGFYRVCENNVMADGTFHPHVWFSHSRDRFRHNLVVRPYKPIGMPGVWGDECDGNFLHVLHGATAPAGELQKLSRADKHSLAGDALYVKPAAGDFRVKENSPALALGFRNFDMSKFGVRPPALKAIARTPKMPDRFLAETDVVSDEIEWCGATVKSMQTEGEKSATGMFDIVGVIFIDVPVGSKADQIGLKPLAVVLEINGTKVRNLSQFQEALAAVPAGGAVTATLWGHQKGKAVSWIK